MAVFRRNRLARSAVNRKVGGSSPHGDVFDHQKLIINNSSRLFSIRYLHITHNPLRFWGVTSRRNVQISPIMILVNSGAFLSISSWFWELTELIFVMILYISSTGYPPKRKGLWVCASSEYGITVITVGLARLAGR